MTTRVQMIIQTLQVYPERKFTARELAKKQCPNVATRDKPRPRVYYWQRNPVPAISQILIPAKERPNVDWQSANRIAVENKDFHHYIDQVSIYNQTDRLVASAWNK
ncbi:hypothetical protein SAMN05216419_1002102 [Nitrosomonas cryotolerans]|uniref:Uncharacterized protein n=1 Tax=Nitrosomonas cryotolerans ATCC 49181 TaxID=1131553 RepID=A0A1N6GWC0_9PROT|nr:hypothetical protein [Nitrosomonas cryotolerans]SFP41747.1 hypothetical protein SAMN05216419_1002102 [Nitrosomonas cryotolerans]SIO11762.1 hypothetical protein SAMN02743940_0895 [Nitrosomonas cryotolerans ATCC 49181]